MPDNPALVDLLAAFVLLTGACIAATGIVVVHRNGKLRYVLLAFLLFFLGFAFMAGSVAALT